MIRKQLRWAPNGAKFSLCSDNSKNRYPAENRGLVAISEPLQAALPAPYHLHSFLATK